jgi:hypothetical protein
VVNEEMLNKDEGIDPVKELSQAEKNSKLESWLMVGGRKPVK